MKQTLPKHLGWCIEAAFAVMECQLLVNTNSTANSRSVSKLVLVELTVSRQV